MRSKKTLSVAIVAALIAAASACSKPRKAPVAKPGKAEKPAPVKAVEGGAQKEKAQGENAAAKKAEAAKPAPEPAPLPAPATPAAPPPKLSIMPHFAVGKSDAFALPVAGKVARIRLAPTIGDGGAVTAANKLFGGELVAFVVRADGGWASRVVADKLERGSANLKIRFPTGGSHVLWGVFQPEGREVAAVPTFFAVSGKPGKPPEEPADPRLFRDGKGLEVALQMAAEVAVCDAAEVASIWTRKVKPLPLKALDGATVQYIAVDGGGSTIVLGKPAGESNAKTTSDRGSRATLTLPGPGRWLVWAFADSGKRTYAARFGVRATGSAPEGGCKP